jgi:hypothetical protein
VHDEVDTTLPESRKASRRSLILLAAVTSVAVAAQGAQEPTVEEALRLASGYLDRYEKEVVSVMCQEDYTQTIPGTSPTYASSTSAVRPTLRQLRSDFLILSDSSGWVEYRDVLRVDEQPVRDHDQRLAKLFMEPHPDARLQARRIVDEGARFNLKSDRLPFTRTLNLPMTALRFLRQENQARSTFTVDGTENGRRVIVLRFTETADEPLIGSNDGARAEGAFWIDAVSGRVNRSDLTLPGYRVTARFRVEFAEQRSLRLWLPATMDESYSRWGVIEMSGRATYSKYKQFKVDVDSTLK